MSSDQSLQVAEYLEIVRESRGITKSTVKTESGVGWQQCQKLFSGDWHGLTWNSIDKVGKALGISIDELLANGLRIHTDRALSSESSSVLPPEFRTVPLPKFKTLAEMFDLLEGGFEEPGHLPVKVLEEVIRLPGYKALVPAPGDRLGPGIITRDYVLLWFDATTDVLAEFTENSGIAVLTRDGSEFIGYGHLDTKRKRSTSNTVWEVTQLM